MNIYLNLDGVLHPNHVTYKSGCIPELTVPGHGLLQHSRLLTDVLNGHPRVDIVLNTWWTHYLDLDTCLNLLPTALASRVIGAVLRLARSTDAVPHRLREAEHHIASTRCRAYLILDHACARYGSLHLPHLLAVDEEEGLAAPFAAKALAHRITHYKE